MALPASVSTRNVYHGSSRLSFFVSIGMTQTSTYSSIARGLKQLRRDWAFFNELVSESISLSTLILSIAACAYVSLASTCTCVSLACTCTTLS
jgi:hypothetical protein